MTYPSIIFLALIAWSFFWPRERVYYLLFASFSFGSLALFPPNLIGGLNILPGQAVCVVMVVRQLAATKDLHAITRSAFLMTGAGLMTLYWIWASISAFTLPGVFQGQIMIIPVRGGGSLPLFETPQNFTTFAYLSMSFLLMILVQFQAKQRGFTETICKAIVFGGAVLALTGLLDVVLGAGQKAYFAPFKTAQYTFMDGSETLGLRRVEGLMSEASSYGPLCLSFAAFLILGSPSFSSRVQRYSAQLVGWCLVVLAAMSTSSAAYAGIAVLGMCIVANLGFRILAPMGMRDRLLAWDASTVLIAVIVVLGIYLYSPEAFSTPAAFLDAVVFKKSLSSSFADRSWWNKVAMDAFTASKGIGVGLGSTRTSNFGLAVISNTGVFGALLLGGFYLLQFIKKPLGPEVVGVVRTSRFAILVTLSTMLLVGTSPDIGLVQASLFGVIIANTALSWGRRRSTSALLTPGRPLTGVPSHLQPNTIQSSLADR